MGNVNTEETGSSSKFKEPKNMHYDRWAEPSCRIKYWMDWKTDREFFTGGEKWMCEGYKTESPGELSNIDKYERSKWPTIEELKK